MSVRTSNNSQKIKKYNKSRQQVKKYDISLLDTFVWKEGKVWLYNNKRCSFLTMSLWIFYSYSRPKIVILSSRFGAFSKEIITTIKFKTSLVPPLTKYKTSFVDQFKVQEYSPLQSTLAPYHYSMIGRLNTMKLQYLSMSTCAVVHYILCLKGKF